jgi:HlyD family secretion protein
VATPSASISRGGVIAEGKVVPANSVNLTFEFGGAIAELLVEEGDVVAAGQPLARLDTRELGLEVERAQVSLDQAQAEYDRLLEGATPEEVAVAQAEVARAAAQLEALQGSVTSSDLAAARAELDSARARLAELTAGPKNPDVQSAQAAVDEARINLQSRRDALSQAKVNAELELNTAANALRNAQDEYSRIYWENRRLEALPGDLPQEEIDAEAAAQRAVADAETALAQAQLVFDQARQAEITGIQAAETRVRDAEARLDKLLSPADADLIAEARARIAAAQARIDALTGGQRTGELNAAAASVTGAEARLSQIQADPTESTIASAMARVRGAEVGLNQAKLALEKATLVSPIAGTIVRLNLKVGEVPDRSLPAAIVADFSSWQIETEDLTELSIVQVREGDQVTLTFDALPGFELPGTVERIEPLGQNRQGDVVYTVIVRPSSWDDRLRWNMTASVIIGDE